MGRVPEISENVLLMFHGSCFSSTNCFPVTMEMTSIALSFYINIDSLVKARQIRSVRHRMNTERLS